MTLRSQKEVAEQLSINYNTFRVLKHRHKDEGFPHASGFRGGWTKQDIQRLERWLKERGWK